jgi:hypothetical protein
MLPFLKEVSAAVAALAALQQTASERAKSARRRAPPVVWADVDVGARLAEANRFRSAEMWERLDPLLEYSRGELERFIHGQLSLFAFADHAALPTANPPRPMLKAITTALFRAGFTAREIVMLIDDGGDQDLASPRSKPFTDAVGRVYKRLNANGNAAASNGATATTAKRHISKVRPRKKRD